MSSTSTGIEWTDATWNCIRGCSPISPGCAWCYAPYSAIRQLASGYAGLVKSTSSGPRWTGEVRLIEHLVDQPLRWRDGRRIFVNSMSDLFHEKVEDAWSPRKKRFLSVIATISFIRRHAVSIR